MAFCFREAKIIEQNDLQVLMETHFSSSIQPLSQSGTVTEAEHLSCPHPHPHPHPHPIGTISQSSSRSTAPERLTGACANGEIPPSDVISSEYFDYRVPFPGGHTLVAIDDPMDL